MNGSDSKAKLTVEAVVENLEKVTSFVDERLEEVECPVKVQMKINIAVDEILSQPRIFPCLWKNGRLAGWVFI